VSSNNLDQLADINSIDGLKLRLTFAKYGEVQTGSEQAVQISAAKSKHVQVVPNSPHIENIIVSQIPKLGRIVAASGQ
jgi:hypothetical protein